MNLTFNIKKTKQQTPSAFFIFILRFLFIIYFLGSTPSLHAQVYGPEPSAAKLYVSNNGSVSGQIACTTAADTDNSGADHRQVAIPTGATPACYVAGASVQWIKFSTPEGINQIKLQVVGNAMEAYALYWTTAGLNSSPSLSDLNYLTCSSSSGGGFDVITNPEIDANETGYYYIALIYSPANNNGSVNFKTKECAQVDAYNCYASDAITFANCSSSSVTQTITVTNSFTVSEAVDLSGLSINMNDNNLIFSNVVTVDRNTVFNGGSSAGVTNLLGQKAGSGGFMSLADLNTALLTGNYSTLTDAMASQLLPVELEGFTAKLDNEQVVLNWTTLSETNNDYFEIEFSTDGKTFSFLDEVSGAGTSDERQFYQFRHTDFSKKINYYRLKQVDFDGAFSYSKVVVVEISSDNPIQIYPTVVSNELQYRFNSTLETSAKLRILDWQGRGIEEIRVERNTISGNLETSGLPKGNYLLQLVTEQGVFTNRFVKL